MRHGRALANTSTISRVAPNAIKFGWHRKDLCASHEHGSIARLWDTDRTMMQPAPPAGGQRSDALLQMAAELERKLAEVDAMGVHLAAADIDSAIARLRFAARS
ncbi:hypothetical protein GCM10022213_04280 [Parerythrobacter jejuensis]